MVATDTYPGGSPLNPGLSAPATGIEAVTPNDGADLVTVSRAIWVGGAGAIAVVMRDGTTATISGVPAGTMLPLRVSRVKSTGTTATLIVSLS